MVGAAVGAQDGPPALQLGASVGRAVGALVGNSVGCAEGTRVGAAVGAAVGATVGATVQVLQWAGQDSWSDVLDPQAVGGRDAMISPQSDPSGDE